MPDQIALLAAIDAYEAQAHGGNTDDGELSKQRSLALDAYAGKMLDVPPDGRSMVNDRTVFETVQWIMPSMMRIFGGDSSVVEFDPIGPDDEEIAEQESLYLNHMVTQKNDWELTVREWCQDALLTKNAYCMVSMEERLIPEVETYEGQREEQVALLLEDDLEIVGQNQYDDPDDPGVMIDPATGQPIDPQDQATMVGAMAIYESQGMEPQMQRQQLYDIQVRQVTAKKELRFDVLPPEHCKVGQNTKDFTLADCDYFEFWELVTISDLRKLGYEVPDDIADDGYEADTQEDASRDEPFESSRDYDSPDASMRQVACRTVWVRFDYDEDGIAELQRVVLVGNTVLDMEPATRIPVACIVPFINTHRHPGNSVADLVFEIQRIKTSMLRSGLDSLQLATNPRHAISDKVTIDDMLVSRPGGLVRLRNGAVPGEGHVMPIQTENTFPFAQQGMEAMDRIVEARVGVNRIFQGIDSSNLNDHNRIGQLSTMAAQRVEDIARLFGTGFKRLFSLAHELIIKSGSSGEQMKLGGKWVQVDPTQWRTGRDMRVTAPFAAGNKDSLLQRLLIIANIHEKALAAGLPIVDVQDAYNLSLEIGKAADLPATKFFTDPSTVEPSPPPPDYTMMALEIENKKADNSAADSQTDAEMDKYKADLDAQVKQYQVDTNAQVQMALAQIKEGQQVNLEKLRANLKVPQIDVEGEKVRVSDAFTAVQDSNQQMAAIFNSAMDDLKAAATAPKEVVRDESGKVAGVKVNGEVRAVQRDSDGKITGVE